TQLIAKDNYEILEWIPYNKLSSINYHDQGGFGEIHKAIWLDGPIYGWNNGIDKWEMSQYPNKNYIMVMNNYNELFINDFGLCKPISDIQDSDNDNEPYGVLPYMAPEILRKNPCTPASEIYSFSMIMWEFTS
ncbi:hypothetical protein GLOIN_2v1597944, partial [Rhizophagus irregularis DAOM 181602=DAOM 197198]